MSGSNKKVNEKMMMKTGLGTPMFGGMPQLNNNPINYNDEDYSESSEEEVSYLKR